MMRWEDLVLVSEELWARARGDFAFAFHLCDVLEKIGQKIDLKDEESLKKPQVSYIPLFLSYSVLRCPALFTLPHSCARIRYIRQNPCP